MKDYTLVCVCATFAYAFFRYLRVRHSNNSAIKLAEIQKTIEIEKIHAQRDVEFAKIDHGQSKVKVNRSDAA